MDNETAAPTPRLWKEVARRGLTSCIPRPGRRQDQPVPAAQGPEPCAPPPPERIAKALGLPKTALFYPVREEKAPERAAPL